MRWTTELCNAVTDGKIPEDWSMSWLVKVNKEKKMC